MALLETDPTFRSHELPFAVDGAPSSVYFTHNQQELPVPAVEDELDVRFEQSRIHDLTENILIDTLGADWREAMGERQFFVGVVPAVSENADAARMVEVTKFSKKFSRPRSRVYEEYSEYDENSTFLMVIDTHAEKPTPAGVIRIIEPNETTGLKSINDFVEDKDGNPWIDELKALHFAPDEEYDPREAWMRLCVQAGVPLDPAESHDVATIAVLDEYSTGGGLDGPSIALYHTCLRYALGNGIKNLVSIQDVVPLQFLQKFGNCFSLFEDIQPHPYGGPFDTIPAWAELQEGMRRVRSSGFGGIFIHGEGLEDYLFLKDYQPEKYSDAAVGLVPTQEHAA